MSQDTATTATVARVTIANTVQNKTVKLLTRESFDAAIVRGTPKARESYIREVATLAAAWDGVKGQAVANSTVAGAYAIHALDTLNGNKPVSYDKILADKLIVGATGEVVSKSRISHLRTYARLLFDLDYTPETLPPASEVKRVSTAISAKAATPASVAAALADKPAVESKPADKPADKPASAPAPKADNGGKSVATRVEDCRTLLAGISEMSPSEWLLAYDLATELAAILSASKSKAEGMALLSKRDAKAKADAAKASK